MIIIRDYQLCEEIGLRHQQTRTFPLYRNLWWSFDHDRKAFGYGDLGKMDLDKIYAYLCKEENQKKVFTGWNEHHGTEFQQTEMPIIRMSYAAGVTNPFHFSLEMMWR